MSTIIDLTPSWREWPNIYTTFANHGETKAVRALQGDLMRMAWMADAFNKLLPLLNEDQKLLYVEFKKANPL